MKKIFTSAVLFIFITNNIVNAQAPDWLWAKQAEGTNGSWGTTMFTDALGNSYVAGQFQGPSMTLGATTLSSPGPMNIFLAKYDASGNIIWANNTVGNVNGFDEVLSICADAEGNCYITGQLSSEALIFGRDTLTNPSSGSVFVAKYNAAGKEVWARKGGGSTAEFGISVSTDTSGNCYVSGNVSGYSIVFGIDTFQGQLQNFFYAKYDSIGNVIWANVTSTDGTSGGEIIADANGNSYVTGGFDGSYIILGNDTLLDATGNSQDFFLAKLDTSGKVIWAKKAGQTGSQQGTFLSLDADGNIYVAGIFDSYPLIFGNDTLNSHNNTNFFLVKFNPSGDELWARSERGTPVYFPAIKTDASGNIFMCGSFTSREIVLGTDTLINKGTENFFIAEYDPSGNLIWTDNAGSTDSSLCYAIGADANDNIYVSGSFSSSFINFGNTSLMLTGPINLFVAKLDNNITTGMGNKNTATSNLVIFPNPSTGQFYFKGVSAGSTIEIYNVFGQQIYSSPVTGDNYMVTLSGIAKGIYFYNVRNKTEEVQQGKIVVAP